MYVPVKTEDRVSPYMTFGKYKVARGIVTVKVPSIYSYQVFFLNVNSS